MYCAAWEESTHSAGKIRFFADATGELAKATGLDVDAKPLGGTRFKRFSALLQDGVVQQLSVEPDSLYSINGTQRRTHTTVLLVDWHHAGCSAVSIG